MAVEKRVTSPLMEPNSIEKILEVDSHVGEFKMEKYMYVSKRTTNAEKMGSERQL